MKILGAVVLTSLVLLPVRWQPGVTAAYDPKTETVVDARGNLRVPGNYRTAHQSLGSWATVSHAQTLKGWFVLVKDSKNSHPGNKLWGNDWGWSWFVRCREPFKNHIHRLQGELSALP
jgi:hypothetical protein